MRRALLTISLTRIKEKENRMEITLPNQVGGMALIMGEAEAEAEEELWDIISIGEGQTPVVNTMVNMIGWSVSIMSAAQTLRQIGTLVEEVEPSIEDVINMAEEAEDLAVNITMVEEAIIITLIKVTAMENNITLSHHDRSRFKDIVELPP